MVAIIAIVLYRHCKKNGIMMVDFALEGERCWLMWAMRAWLLCMRRMTRNPVAAAMVNR